MAARSRRPQSHTVIAIAWFVAAAVSVQAQEKPKDQTKDEKIQEVVITGSRILRPDLDRLEPTTVVKSEVFDERGYTDVGQALQELPAFGVSPSSAVNQQQGFGVAQSFVDLYSLGSQRTLTLINGRRFVSSSTASLSNGATSPGQQVDLNVVPTKLIDRIETISVGGAPIYGADAISGTVNIILKKDYQGLDFDYQVGDSKYHDAWNHRLRALAGTNFADGRGNITGVLELFKSDGLTGPDRANIANDLGFLAPLNPGNFKTVLMPNNAVGSISTSGVPYLDDFFYLPPGNLPFPTTLYGVTDPSGNPLAWSPGSSALSRYNLGGPTGNPVFWVGGDGARLSQFTNLLSPQKRGNADVLGNFKFTDHLALFTEGWFSSSHATNEITQPAYNTPFFCAPNTPANCAFRMSVNNPYLSPQDQTTIQNDLNAYAALFPLFAAPGTTPGPLFTPLCGPGAPPNCWDGHHFWVDRASTDLQSGHANVDQVVARTVIGMNGDFTAGQRSYNWEIAANYGYSRDTNRTPLFVYQNVLNALNATRDASGNIVCTPGYTNSPVATGQSTCAPLNIFGLGVASSQALAYITHNAIAKSIDTQRDLTANLTGPILKLPAGDWKFAVGFENRKETADFRPDDYYTLKAGQNVASPVSGGYHTNEFYAETLVPVFEPLQSIRMLHSVELEGAVRRVNNSVAGDSTTWTAGLRWAPVEDVLFRGNKTHSIRAPAVTELFLPPSTSFEFANDPCDKGFINKGPNPTQRAANCAAAGIPSGFVSNVVNATAVGLTSGNPNVTSEIADAKTFGVVMRPRFLPRLNVTVDYIDISMTNAIELLTLQDLMQACYDSPTYPNTPACSLFTRDVNHQVSGYNDGFRNAALFAFQGVSIGSDWTFGLPRALGGIELRANWLNTRKLIRQVGTEDPSKLLGELATTTASPHDRGTLDINYRKGPFGWSWQGQYIGPFNFDNQDCVSCGTPPTTSKDVMGVSHWWLINTTIGYEVTRQFQTRLIVNNVFNREPPYPGVQGVGGNFDSPTSLYWAGVLGRSYLLSLSYRF